MNIDHRLLTPHIYLLSFDTQHDLTSTFLRFQEHYESPRFKGEVFTLDEFQDWYIKNSPNGIKTGEFTYHSDWNGFNIPSHILKPFYEGKFDPLSSDEQAILELFKDHSHVFYVIGVHKESNNPDALLEHEIAHGLFTTNEEYRKEVLEALSQFDIEPIKEELRNKGGYHEDVLVDEVHAYSLGTKLKTPIPLELSQSIRSIFDRYFKV